MSKILYFLLLIPTLVFSHPTVLVYDVTNSHVIAGELEHNPASIASLTKLMTVYTVLKFEQNLDEKLKVVNKRTTNTKLKPNILVTRRELIYLSLVSSDNLAAYTLASNFPGGMTHFVRTMNYNAMDLEMFNTRFHEPTGLSPMNYSNLNDLLILTKEVNKFQIFNDAAKTNKTHTTEITTVKNKKSKQETIKSNTTIKYFGRDDILIVKTGFTNAAGFCVTILVEANKKLYNIIEIGRAHV